MKSTKFNSLRNSAMIGALTLLPVLAHAQTSTGVDFATAATDMKTQALAAIAVVGLAVLAVAAAIAAFRKGKSLVK